MELEEIKQEIYSSFAETASSLGYSEVHGRILAALLTHKGDMSLQELSEETNYSHSSISTSLDLLEVLGIVSRVKKSGDRKLYVKLDGDLLQGAKRAVIMRTMKNLESGLGEFEDLEERLENIDNSDEKKDVKDSLITLKKELKRLKKYMSILEDVDLPED